MATDKKIPEGSIKMYDSSCNIRYFMYIFVNINQWQCSKKEDPMPYVMVFVWGKRRLFVFFNGGIVDHHCLNFLFIIQKGNNPDEKYKKILKHQVPKYTYSIPIIWAYASLPAKA
jgi:hypothetical protein